MSVRKHHISWNPSRIPGHPCHRINTVDYLRADSPTLVADTKMLCKNSVSLTGSPSGQYFEQRARAEFLESMVVTNVSMHGVLTIPDLVRSINLIPGGGDKWHDFAFEMRESGYPISARVEEEIATARHDPSGGYQGILGELFKAFACYSDPNLLDSLSPPYDFSYWEMTDPTRRFRVSLLVRPEQIGSCGHALKSHFVAGRVYKSRAPEAPRQTWVLDECATLAGGDSKGFPIVPQLFSVDAGLGIRPICVVQTSKQLNALGPDAQTIITASAAVQCRFAVRDLESATELSNRLGTQTLIYDDEKEQGRARHAAEKAMGRLLDGGNTLDAMADYAHHSREASMQSKQMRLLRTPAEILNMPPDKMIVHADGLPHAIEADRKPYYEQRWLAGRFYPNRQYGPSDRIRVKTWFGHDWLRVIREPAPFTPRRVSAVLRWLLVSDRTQMVAPVTGADRHTRLSHTHERDDLRADSPLYERAGSVRPDFRAAHDDDAERAARRESFMVKRQKSSPILRPSPALSLGPDGEAFDSEWNRERDGAQPRGRSQ